MSVRDGSGPDCRRWALSSFETSAPALVRVRDATQAICSLPAVPTQDWLDHAAATLTHAAEGSVVLTILVSLDASSRIRTFDSAGAAAASTVAQPTLDLLRVRANRLQAVSLGDWLPGQAPLVARLSDLVPDWRIGSFGRVWPTPHPSEIIVAAAGAGDVPTLIAFVAAPQGADAALSVISVVMPLLAEATSKCLAWSPSDSRSLLTVKEQEVLAHLAQGRSVKQIAEALGRSPHTVHDHVKALHRKLNASSRGELIAKALGHLPSARPAAEASRVSQAS